MGHQINIGIDDSNRKKAAEQLGIVLASTYTLYLKTHNFHWNVVGPNFYPLHELFEEQYNELATAVDDIAERIRALGCFAPGSYSQFAKLSKIQETEGVSKGEETVRILAEDNETMSRIAREAIAALEGTEDEVTSGLLGERMSVHEKTAWMLRSHLE